MNKSRKIKINWNNEIWQEIAKQLLEKNKKRLQESKKK